ncbi:hypothetical protein GCM10007392_17950 [Saccharospirillum salsuginis]|uniref:Uncharacterized protein n=2 Tax=Saccharospirillum salsuginis TaxID=418750 RepID=A0A918K7I4_9GAMM|nr:hypothetical protein GCM10007392_17950 [Saccharospirillum salsuginis]
MACSPTTPRDVTHAYWQAMIEDDAETVTRLSTLVSTAAYDGYDQSWQGVDFSLGRIVIDQQAATVDVVLSGLSDANGAERTVTTHLVQTDDRWRVDYYATYDAFNDRPIVDRVMGTLSGLSDRLSSEWSRHSSQAAREMEQLARELRQRADEMNRKLEPELERYAQALQNAIEQLVASLREALENTPSASPADKRNLNQTIYYLEQQQNRLEQPDLQGVAESSQALTESRIALAELGSEFSDYQNQWQQLFDEMRETIQSMLSSTE